MDENHEFDLTEEELECLQQLASGNHSLASLFSRTASSLGRKVVIRLSRAEAEQLRDYLTDQLAAVGFDANYFPNVQGQMLEKFIDRFFLP